MLAELLQLVTISLLSFPLHDQSLFGVGLGDDMKVNVVNDLFPVDKKEGKKTMLVCVIKARLIYNSPSSFRCKQLEMHHTWWAIRPLFCKML
jgi:hypothetical protein